MSEPSRESLEKTCNGDGYCQYRYQNGSLMGCKYMDYCDFQRPLDSTKSKQEGKGAQQRRIEMQQEENKRLHEENVELSKDKRDLTSHLESLKAVIADLKTSLHDRTDERDSAYELCRKRFDEIAEKDARIKALEAQVEVGKKLAQTFKDKFAKVGIDMFNKKLHIVEHGSYEHQEGMECEICNLLTLAHESGLLDGKKENK